MSALFTLNGFDGVDLRMCLPRVGVWHADISVDIADQSYDFSGSLTLNVDGNDFTCARRRGGTTADVAVMRLVGGAGGLATQATPKSYSAVTPQVILNDLFQAAGEALSSTVDPSLLSVGWSSWSTPAWPTAVVLGELVSKLGADVLWRIQPDGTVWIGRESWPTVKPSVVVTQVDDRLGKAMLHLLDGALVMPGTIWNGVNVDNAIVTSFDGDRLNEEVWFQ
jgi:hypothetical protein